MTFGSATRVRATVVALAVVAGLASVSVGAPVQADTAPPTGTPATVSADALATWQVDGVVWDQAVVGNNVFAGGSFTKARPAGVALGGTGEVAAGNFMVYDITTGNRVASMAHSLNGQVLAVQASPDGSRVYVGGDFTTVDGTTRNHIAAFDAKTGALITTFKPSVDAQVGALAVSSTAVYAGGSFSSVGGTARGRLAAFSPTNGALQAWAPTADQKVAALLVSPDSSKVIVAGSFSAISGTTAPGMSAVDPSTGAVLPWAANQKITNGGGTACGITSLSTDGTQVYGSGFAYGCGNFEGTFAANPSTGALVWANDCHGDTYDTYPSGQVLYSVTHAHDCTPIGAYPESPVRATNTHRALAYTTYPTGTNTGPDSYGWNYSDTADSTMLQWYPELKYGTFTGQSQAAWTVTGNGKYVVLGGEFPSVNGTPQQGLVRFAVRDTAPNKRAPVKAPDAPAPTAISQSSGTVRVAWQSAYDMDNASLKYDVYRSGTTAPIYSTTKDSNFWTYPMQGYVDKGLTPGASYTYTIKVTDPIGNVLTLPKTAAVTVGSAAPSAYTKDVLADGASNFYRLGESTGTSTVYDYAGFNDGVAGAGVTRGAAGAIGSDTDQASTFGGGTDGSVSQSSMQAAPASFTVESWVRTTSTSGGKIVGYANTKTGNSSGYDRHVYMDNAGHIIFGLYPGSVRTLQSSKTYNDGAYHHIVASLSSTTGMTLYVDGRKVGADAGTTSGQVYSGYWRIGGDNLNGWTNTPSSYYLNGTIDDVAIYPSALSQAQVQQHFTDAGGVLSGAPKPTDTYGKAVYDSAPDLYWRLGESNGTTAQDSSGNDARGTYFGGTTPGQAGAVSGTTDTSVTLDGTSGGLSSVDTVSNPRTYSEELWFKTTTTQGGKLIGFGSSATGGSGNYDRHVYMETNGQLTFGTYTGSVSLATSPKSYNDGTWHHLVAAQGADGMALYVDGDKVATNPQTGAQGYTGYWRVGGDNTWNSTFWFKGSIDEVAVYSRALSASTVAEHYNAGKGVTPNVKPTAAFSSATADLKASFDGSGSTDSDGSVASYAWDFGDSSAAGAGAKPDHTYAQAGTYHVTLTVTDNQGLTGTVTHDVTVTAANVKPTAAFSSGTADLKASFDGSGSTDSDGSVASYAWDFGDSSAAGAGAKPDHTYAQAGTYHVTLTVTDNQGLTGTVTHDVVVTAPVGPTLIGSDDFTRSVTGGWGSADQGGTWTLTGGKTNFKVADGVGTMTMAAAGSSPVASLGGVSSKSSDVQVAVSPQKLATGGGTYATVIGRAVGTSSYRSTLIFKSNGTVSLGLSKVEGSTTTSLVASKVISGLTYAAGDKVNVRMQTVGTSPTTVQARVWKAGTTEPTTWQVSATDTTAALQAAGSVGLNSYLSGSATDAPTNLGFDALRLYDTGQ